MITFEEFLRLHPKVKEKSITNRRLKHKDLVSLLSKYTVSGTIQKKIIGQSVNGRSIYKLQLGRGPVKVMMWSQMHGNEPTATAAICDICNLLCSGNTDTAELFDLIFEKLTILIVPMLNPDGAEQYIRYNALGIDLNRDAKTLVSPEAVLLKETHDAFKPDFAFNLHDQRRIHGVSSTGKPATISFLSPDASPGTIQPNNQKDAMRLIAHLYEHVAKGILDGHVARYNDEYTSTAFGDNFQSWGPKTVLLESGGFYQDYERQVARQYNFAILLEALKSIATKEYESKSTADYVKIPENKSFMHDIIFKGIQVSMSGADYQVDIAVDLVEVPTESDFEYEIYVAKVGDLRLFNCYQEIDASTMAIRSKGPIQSESYESFTIVDKSTEEVIYDLSENLINPEL